MNTKTTLAPHVGRCHEHSGGPIASDKIAVVAAGMLHVPAFLSLKTCDADGHVTDTA